MAKKASIFHIIFIVSLPLVMHKSIAQSTPSEFAEMSLEELFNSPIDTENKTEAAENIDWTITYQYKNARFSGYLDGSEELSNEDVLFRPGEEARTDKNFPVLPTIITQEVHIFKFGAVFSDRYRTDLFIPHIRQSTDHISIVPGYDTFLISTSGLGDIGISTGYKFSMGHHQTWWINAGLSLPTGSIDEEGDTPREPGDQQLPYTMQLGSGTWDFPFQISYHNNGKHPVGVFISGIIRTGKNDRNYRLGNNYSFSTNYRHNLNNSFQVVLNADAQYSRAIVGRDTSITIEGDFPYPAGITNPNLYGGTVLSLRLGLNFKLSKATSATVDFSKPIHQSLNGPQPKKNWHGSMQISRKF